MDRRKDSRPEKANLLKSLIGLMMVASCTFKNKSDLPNRDLLRLYAEKTRKEMPRKISAMAEQFDMGSEEDTLIYFIRISDTTETRASFAGPLEFARIGTLRQMCADASNKEAFFQRGISLKFIYSGGKRKELLGQFSIKPSDCESKEAEPRKNCLEGVDLSILTMEGSFHLEKVYPLLVKYKSLFGRYPEKLDSLASLDSVDYSYLTSAWKLKYRQIDHGKTFDLQNKPEGEIESIYERILKARDEMKKGMRDC